MAKTDFSNGWVTDGYWWVGEDYDKRVPGTLTFRPDEAIILVLNGSFYEFESRASQNEVIPIVNGMVKDGGLVCLTHCAVGASQLHTPGYYCQEYIVNSVLVGINAASTDDLRFEKAFFDVDNIWSWLQPPLLKQNLQVSADNKLVSYSVSLAPLELPEYQLDEGKLIFGLSYDFKNAIQNRANFGGSVSAGFQFESPKSPAVLTNSYGTGFQELMTLITGRHCKIRKITLFSSKYKSVIDGKPSPHDQAVICLLPTIHGSLEIYEWPITFLFTYADIKDRAGELLRNWFRRKEVLSPAYDLYFHITHHHDILTQHAFLSFVNCVEVFHRRVFQQVDLTAHAARVESFKNSLTKSDWEWIAGRLTYAYEPGLRKRLKELWEKMPSLVKDRLGDRDVFAEHVTNARNYLTHYDEKTKSAYDATRLHEFIAKLRMMIRSLFLMELGFSGDRLDSAIKKSHNFLFIPKVYTVD